MGMQRYAHDGVFFPNDQPTAQGPKAIQEAYANIFNTVQLNVKFNFEGTYVSSDEDLAILLTSSAGKAKVLALGVEVPEENREMFFLEKEHDAWKISSYMFNK